MRTTFALIGLAAVASAKTYTTTETADVTVTSCSPTYTGNCPYKPEGEHTWGDWSTTKDPSEETTTTTTTTHWEDWTTTSKDPSKETTTTTTTTSHYWGDWTTTTTTTSKPVDPTTTSSYTWADWTTSTKPADDATKTPEDASKTPAAGTGVWEYSGSPVSPDIATYTGAASSNAGSFVAVGLAAVVALAL